MWAPPWRVGPAAAGVLGSRTTQRAARLFPSSGRGVKVGAVDGDDTKEQSCGIPEDHPVLDSVHRDGTGRLEPLNLGLDVVRLDVEMQPRRPVNSLKGHPHTPLGRKQAQIGRSVLGGAAGQATKRLGPEGS